MRPARDVALIGTYTALLLAGQFVLSGISGVEVVTVLLLAFSYRFGAVRGMLVATAFSLLRCFIFGFFPTVIILYLVYYNLFALLFGVVGRKLERKMNAKIVVLLTVLAAVMTVCFSLLDDAITPLFYGFAPDAARAYFYASFYAMIPQTVCAVVTCSLFLMPLHKAFRAV